MRGPIEPGVVPSVLRSIYRGRKTGMLRFIRGDERRSVRFMSGHIVYGEASMTQLRLGEVLVAHGQLDPSVLERAVAVVLQQRKRMGAVLMEMGILDENGLEQALGLQVRAILASVFSLREGTCTFQDQAPETFLDDDWPLAISTAEAVLAAVRDDATHAGALPPGHPLPPARPVRARHRHVPPCPRGRSVSSRALAEMDAMSADPPPPPSDRGTRRRNRRG